MIFGVRTDEAVAPTADEPLAGLLPGLDAGRMAGVERLHLSGLTAEETATLVAARGLSSAQVDRLHVLSAGNPLAALEMAAYPDLLAGQTAVPVPRLIQRAFRARLEGLGPDARTALLLAALDDVDLTTLARACTAMGVGLIDLEEPERRGLVAIVEDRVVFQHPLLRAAVHQGAEPAVRRAGHRAVAEALGESDLDRRAWHLAEATLGPDGHVATELERSASSALERGAFAVASARFSRSAQLTRQVSARAQRLTQAGETAWLAGLAERALDLLAQAADLAPDATLRTQATALRGVVSARAGALDEARDLLLAAADADPDPDSATPLLAEAAYVCFYLGDTSGTASIVQRLEALRAGELSGRSAMLADLASGMCLILLGDGAEGTARVRRGVDAAAGKELVDDPRWLPWLLLGALWLRESGGARRSFDQVVSVARERAAFGTLPFLLFNVARDDATTDRWAAAEAGFRESISLAAETGQRTDAALSRAGLAWLLARQGREAETRSLADEAERDCRRSRLGLGRLWLRFALGDLEAGLGRTELAVQSYRDLQGLLAELGVTDPDLSPVAELVDCLVRLGDPEGAEREARTFLAFAYTKGQPWSLARAHRAMAVAGVDPETGFVAALATHAHTPDAYERARTQLAYGAYLRRDRRRTEAREHLREALTAFDRLAARPWAEAAAAELTATGERVHRRSDGEVESLTPQEFQVAGLLGAGRTTREAAAALFLSPKTVEYHLRHVYIKLGISSRGELAERIAADPELRTR